MVRRPNLHSDSPEPPMKSMARTTSSEPQLMDRDLSGEEAMIARRRFAALLAAAVLMIGVILSATFLSALTPYWGEIVKIVAVGLFVGSMIALALAMVGDAFRRR
jgi:hypothetical protein